MKKKLTRIIKAAKAISAVTIMLIAIIIVFGNMDGVALVSSATASNTMNINYQVVLAGENDGKPVSDLTVTLLACRFDKNTNHYRICEIVDVPDNPLTSSNNVINGGSTYTFKNLPVLPGDDGYAVSTERNGRRWIETGGVWNNGYLTANGSFDDGHTFPVPSDISSGSLYGFVVLNGIHSMYENRLSGVTVTLYSCLPYTASDGIVNTGVVNVSNNPQVTTGGNEVGMYRFDGLKPGFYNVTIEKDGLVGHKIINFTGDGVNDNWIGDNLVLLNPSPVPADTPTSTPSPTPTQLGTLTPTPSVLASTVPSTTPQPSGDTATPTASATEVPASTSGYQTMLTLVSLAMACGMILSKVKDK